MVKFLNKLKLFLEKLGTVLVDRRLAVSVIVGALITIAVNFGLRPEDAEALKALFGDSYALLVVAIPLAVKAISYLILGINLVVGWTKRPPSGLGFKEILRD